MFQLEMESGISMSIKVYTKLTKSDYNTRNTNIKEADVFFGKVVNPYETSFPLLQRIKMLFTFL